METFYFNYSSYFNLMISQFFDVKRSDFIAMFIHHICTIVLLAGSYSYNWLKLGSLSMFLFFFELVCSCRVT